MQTWMVLQQHQFDDVIQCHCTHYHNSATACIHSTTAIQHCIIAWSWSFLFLMFLLWIHGIGLILCYLPWHVITLVDCCFVSPSIFCCCFQTNATVIGITCAAPWFWCLHTLPAMCSDAVVNGTQWQYRFDNATAHTTSHNNATVPHLTQTIGVGT